MWARRPGVLGVRGGVVVLGAAVRGGRGGVAVLGAAAWRLWRSGRHCCVGRVRLGFVVFGAAGSVVFGAASVSGVVASGCGVVASGGGVVASGCGVVVSGGGVVVSGGGIVVSGGVVVASGGGVVASGGVVVGCVGWRRCCVCWRRAACRSPGEAARSWLLRRRLAPAAPRACARDADGPQQQRQRIEHRPGEVGCVCGPCGPQMVPRTSALCPQRPALLHLRPLWIARGAMRRATGA